MTEKQSRFVEHYLQTANASEAARQAGYSEKTARFIGSENLTKPNIATAIDERLKQMASERIADTEEVLSHLTSVLRGEVTETVVTQSGKSFVVPVSERDKLKSAEMLLKVAGAFNDKLNVKVDSGQLFIQTLEKISAELEEKKNSSKARSRKF